MRLAVVGSRGFKDRDLVIRHITKIWADEIVSGGAVGPDSFAEEWAKDNGIKVTVFKPNWRKYGKSAGPIRNKEIVSYADRVVAFWDGKSAGTKSSINFAVELKKPLEVVYQEPSHAA